jgi:hypothetical protein
MLKKTITYNDLDGNPITEDFWFHMSRGEMAEMALGKEGRAGGFDTWVRRLIESQDGEVLIQTFKEILLMTLGQRSDDNKYFEKDEKYTRRFVQSDAYSVLLMELLTDEVKMAEFINGVMPKEMREQAEKDAKEGKSAPSLEGPQARVQEKTINASSEQKDDRPDWLKEGRVPTEQELKGASQEHILAAFKLRSQNAGPISHEEITGS